MISSNKSIFILAASTLLVIIAIVLPLLHLIQKSSQELASQKKELALFTRQESSSENIIDEYNTFKDNLEKIDNLFVSQSFPVEFRKFLDETASNSQGKMKVSAAKEGADNTLSFSISFEGSFPSLLKFIDKLENSPSYLIEIVSLNSKKSAGNVISNLELIVLSK